LPYVIEMTLGCMELFMQTLFAEDLEASPYFCIFFLRRFAT